MCKKAEFERFPLLESVIAGVFWPSSSIRGNNILCWLYRIPTSHKLPQFNGMGICFNGILLLGIFIYLFQEKWLSRCIKAGILMFLLGSLSRIIWLPPLGESYGL